MIGALIGDGYIKGTIIDLTNPDDEIIGRIRRSLPSGMFVATRDNGSCLHHVIRDSTPRHNRLKRYLKALGLEVGSGQKFIPKEYLYGSVKDRIDLLRGLMDTDGTVSAGNSVSYSSTSRRLAFDLATLVQGLGGVAIIHRRKRAGKSLEFHINVKTFFNPFYLSRKAARWRASKKNPPSRFIKSIKPLGRIAQACISVAAQDHLYLTDHFICTHNTTLAIEIAHMQRRTMFAAFTGKAALVMQRKGCAGASTIHSLIYKVRDGIDGSPEFTIDYESPLKEAGLLIIDECSMVDEELAADLLSFKRPILVIGDPAQLPPVKGAGYFTNADPEVMLTEIHRQARDNPIVKLATDVREGRRLQAGVYRGAVAHHCVNIIKRGDLTRTVVMGSDQRLVGLNRTRHEWNRKIRTILGRQSDVPEIGDRVICLRNKQDKGLLNGQLWTVAEIMPSKNRDHDVVRMRLKPDDGDMFSELEVAAPLELFLGEADAVPIKRQRSLDLFDYGYAITVHKSQGSQWDNVLVMDEGYAFKEFRDRWLYTALTRAAERLTVVQHH